MVPEYACEEYIPSKTGPEFHESNTKFDGNGKRMIEHQCIKIFFTRLW
jgi:hypothetical protein